MRVEDELQRIRKATVADTKWLNYPHFQEKLLHRKKSEAQCVIAEVKYVSLTRLRISHIPLLLFSLICFPPLHSFPSFCLQITWCWNVEAFQIFNKIRSSLTEASLTLHPTIWRQLQRIFVMRICINSVRKETPRFLNFLIVHALLMLWPRTWLKTSWRHGSCVTVGTVKEATSSASYCSSLDRRVKKYFALIIYL
jgi:hypothetical protein